jgi:hypothetical protein
MSEPIAHEPWDENRVGMNVLMHGQPWDRGGPSVLHSPWWLREHWGRGFDVEVLDEEGFGGHGLIAVRKSSDRIAPEALETLSDDPREIAALRHNIRQLQVESLTAREALDEASTTIEALEAKLASVGSEAKGRRSLTDSARALVDRLLGRGSGR